MPDTTNSEIYKIELKLQTDFNKQLNTALNQFETFVDKASKSTGTLEKSLTGMQQNLVASYSGMFAKSRKQVEELAGFSNYVLRNISTSSTKIMQEVQAKQQKLIRATEKGFEQAKKLAIEAERLTAQAKGTDDKGQRAALLDKATKLDEAVAKIKADIIKDQAKNIRQLTRRLADHFDMVSKGVLDKTKAVSAGVKVIVDDALKQYRRIQSQTNVMSKTQGTVAQAQGIVELQTSEKAMYANLKQLREAHATAEKAYNAQRVLRSKQTSNLMKKQHIELERVALERLNSIEKEYIEAAKSAKRFTNEIEKQKQKLRETGGQNELLKSWQAALKPSGIKRMFDRLTDNMRQSMKFAAEGMSEELSKSMASGDKLFAGLNKFKNKLAEIKREAKVLAQAGLIDPKVIGPAIEKAEQKLKELETQFRATNAEFRKFSPKRMAQFSVPELGGLREARKEIAALATQLPKMSQVTDQNFVDFSMHVEKMGGLLKKYAAQRRAAENKILNIEREAANVEKQITGIRDANLRASMEAYVAKLRRYAGELSSSLNKGVKFDESGLKLWQKKMETYARETVDRINMILKNQKPGKDMFKGIEEQYNSFLKLMDKLGNRKLFKGKMTAQAEADIIKLRKSVMEYRTQIIHVQNELKKLERLQARGFRTEEIRKAKAALKEQLQQLKQNIQEVNRYHRVANLRMDQISKKNTKSLFQSGWEMVRNFRWQVAAVIYLVQRAIWAVTNTIGSMFREIAMFRQTAFSLAAQFSFKTVGAIEDNYDRLYQYSRNLLERLQLEAARTILTFEDMMMLTKTLAQAGIIPKTDEDIKRISTIGVAIKTLTEGMANAGVQMRQELYAIIAGRQRATDQLAMMFKVMGVDIQKKIDEARLGKERLDKVLADALAPFTTLNKKMEDEFNTVINRLDTYWKIIKRIGGEDVLQNFTKQLKAMADSLYDLETGNLTDLGKKIAAGINVALNILMEFGNTLKVLFQEWWSAASTMYTAFADILATVGLINKESLGVNKEWSALKVLVATAQGLFITIANIFRMVSLYIKTIYTYMKVIVTTWISVFKLVTDIIPHFAFIKKAAAYIVDFLPDAFKKVYDWITGIFGKFAGFIGKILEWFGDKISKTEAGKEFVDTIKGNVEDVLQLNKAWKEGVENIKTSYDGIGDSLAQIDKIQNMVNQGLKYNFEEMVALPVKFERILEEAGELGKAVGPMEEKALQGLDKINAQAKNRIEKFTFLDRALAANIPHLEKFIEKNRQALAPEQLSALEKWLSTHKATYNELLRYYKYVKDAQVIETEKYNIKMAKQERTYRQWMREALMVPETPKEKATAWMKKMKIDLRALAMENKYFKENYDEVLAAIEKGGEIRTNIAVKEMNLEAQKFIDKASKANAWNNVFDELNIEFSQYVTQIEKSNKLDDERKIKLEAELKIIKAQREAQERLNIAHDAYLAQLDIQSKQAEFMQGAYSPIKQREGEIIALRATHDKEMAEMGKKLSEFNMRWKRNGQWITEADDNVKKLGASYEEQMRLMTIATQREIQKKQMPIWADLVEASNGWADGFTDALSEIVVSVDSVSAALQELQQQILKDVVKTIIKRTITDKLQDALGSGFMGDETPLQKAMGKGGGGKEGATEITASKPLPVTVYNTQDLMDSTIKTIEPMEKLPLEGEAVGAGMKVWVTNWPIGFGEGGGMNIGGAAAQVAAQGVQGVSQDLADISGEIAENTAKAEESSKSWYSGITDVFSNIGNWFKGLFSGGGTGGGGGSTLASLGSMAMQYGSMFMADGGTITEPIVGKGLKSGEIYNFGERTKYGENEIVAPMKKLQRSAGTNKVEYHMPIHLSAIDTQSGTQFLMKHSDVIQGQMIKNLRQNKPIRKGIQNAY